MTTWETVFVIFSQEKKFLDISPNKSQYKTRGNPLDFIKSRFLHFCESHYIQKAEWKVLTEEKYFQQAYVTKGPFPRLRTSKPKK